jgi:hypothetical protein
MSQEHSCQDEKLMAIFVAPTALNTTLQGQQTSETSPAPQAPSIRNRHGRSLQSKIAGRRRRTRKPALNAALNAKSSKKPAPTAKPVSKTLMDCQVAMLHQHLQASGAVQPDLEKRAAVLAFGSNRKPQALQALFSQRYPRSLVTAAAVASLGLVPRDLPLGERWPFPSPMGLIRPRMFVTLPIEQPRIGLSPTIKTFIVLHDSISDRGFDIFFGKAFLQEVFGGLLPPKETTSTVELAVDQTTTANPYSGNHGLQHWHMPLNPSIPGQPLKSVDDSATLPIWSESNPAPLKK